VSEVIFNKSSSAFNEIIENTYQSNGRTLPKSIYYQLKSELNGPTASSNPLVWYIRILATGKHHCFDLLAINHTCQGITQAWPRSICVMLLLLCSSSCRSSRVCIARGMAVAMASQALHGENFFRPA